MPIFGKRKAKSLRPHPYAEEQTSEAEAKGTKIALGWFLMATAIGVIGFILNGKFSDHSGPGIANWTELSYIPLFLGLVLIGTHFLRTRWSQYTTMIGWILFGFYWSLVARDQSDVANFLFAAIGGYLSSYVAYHEWLDLARNTRTLATKFLATATFIAAGTYFMIAAIVPFRIGLIKIVGNHTKWMLDLFGAGSEKGLVFVIDKEEILGPVTFFYPDTYCNPYRADEVGTYCADNGYDVVYTEPAPPTNWFQEMMQYTTDSSPDALHIIPVSIILACTAIQSIMLFVGLFYGTTANWKKKLVFSVTIGIAIYILNLLRNTIIIGFYGLGFASFWFIHDIVGKGLSLIALIGIAAIAFRKFPEFFTALASVLDMVHRDGPIERAFRFGRRRPNVNGSVTGEHRLRREPIFVGIISLLTLNLYGWAWSKNWLKSLDEKTFEARKTIITLGVGAFILGALLMIQGAYQITDWGQINTWESFRAQSNFFYGAIFLALFQVLLAYQIMLVAKASGKQLPWAPLTFVPIIGAAALFVIQKHLEATLDWEHGKYGPTITPAAVDGSINEA